MTVRISSCVDYLIDMMVSWRQSIKNFVRITTFTLDIMRTIDTYVMENHLFSNEWLKASQSVFAFNKLNFMYKTFHVDSIVFYTSVWLNERQRKTMWTSLTMISMISKENLRNIRRLDDIIDDNDKNRQKR